MNELIEETLSKVRDERILIDKLIKAEEDDDFLSREALKEIYKVIFMDTNILVDKMLSQYGEEELTSYIISNSDEESEEDIIDRTTLCFLLSNRYRDLLKKSSFFEENSQYLYAIYLWYIKNSNLGDEEKETLHSFINQRAVQSSFLRRYFAGNLENIEELCVPEKNYGIMSNLVAQKEYYSLLTEVIKDSNNSEMLEGWEEYESVLEARKKLLELEFTAICAEMINRHVSFPLVEEPISDFTEEILQKSSVLANKFLNLRKKRN